MNEKHTPGRPPRIDKPALRRALKACTPVIFGYLPTGFAFGLMLCAAGYSFITAVIMSLVIYTGAGEYLAVSFFINDVSLVQMAVMTFLVNTKHLFYGLSLLEDYRHAGLKKFYMIFALTDETYALLTDPKTETDMDRTKYCFYVSVIDQSAWVFSTFLGAVFGSLVKFDTTGLDFAMTALFIVILINQLKSYKTKLPFIIGTVCGLAALFAIGKENMLLLGTMAAVVLMILFRKRIESNDAHN
jgi:4-azaleucine resistance transporter AzlC